jgi:hypothetical protein
LGATLGAGMKFRVNADDTKGITILTNGYVGIGTNIPATKFEVKGDTNNWTAQFLGSTTTGQSLGPLVTAGTNNSDHAFYVQNASGSTLFFRITGAGIITTPTQVSFKAYLSANAERSKGGVVIVPYNVEEYDTQGNFNTSTNKFTAPVAGKYLFVVNFNAYGLDDTASLRLMLYINSTDIRNLYVIQNMPTGNTGDISISGSDILNLAANDNVDVRILTDGSGTFGMSRDLIWNSFSGHLI